jgi:hypothetical protein
MNRNLLSGYRYTLFVGVGADMGDGSGPPAVVGFNVHADGTTDLIAVVTKSAGAATEWDLGDSTTNTANSITRTYAAPGDYTVTFDALDANITAITLSDSGLTAATIPATWTNVTFIALGNNKLTSFDTHPEWTALTYINVVNNTGLTAFVAHPEWTSLDQLHISNCAFTSFDTHSAWPITKLQIYLNSGLSSLIVHSSWTLLTCYLQSCNLNAAVIDAILITVDVSGATNGFMNYSVNPGAADVSRSGAAATAKAALISDGWVITI